MAAHEHVDRLEPARALGRRLHVVLLVLPLEHAEAVEELGRGIGRARSGDGRIDVGPGSVGTRWLGRRAIVLSM